MPKVRSVKTIEKVLNREYYSYITSMLGATVDYVVDEAIRDLNVVVGDRATAMQYRRARFVKSENFLCRLSVSEVSLELES